MSDQSTQPRKISYEQVWDTVQKISQERAKQQHDFQIMMSQANAAALQEAMEQHLVDKLKLKKAVAEAPVIPKTPMSKARIINYEQSAKLFGSRAKKKLLSEQYSVANVKKHEPEYLCKKDGQKRSVYLMDTVFGPLRFVAEEVKLCKEHIPQKKKDRSIKVGVEVKVIDNRLNNLSRTKIYVVKSIHAELKERKRGTAVIAEKDNQAQMYKILTHKLKRV